MTEAEKRATLERIATDARRSGALLGLNIAVCVVEVDHEHARAYTSPFAAESLDGIAVAQQLRAQSRELWRIGTS
ncbi:MAG: hypothetical protein AB1781_11030 [Pseudomonadota bacterium]